MKKFLAFMVLCTVFFAFLPFPGAAGAGGPPQSVIDPPPQVVTLGPCGIPDCPCGCADGFPCTCGTKVAKATVVKDLRSKSYKEGYAEALRTGKPLVVWVGRLDVPRYALLGMPDYVHCVKDRYEDSPPICVVVGRRVGDAIGDLDIQWLATLGESPTASAVAAALQPPLAKAAVTPAYHPAPAYYTPPVFRGGFGGGRRGGC